MAKKAASATGAQVKVEGYIPSLQKKYKEEIVAKLQKEFGFKTIMQVPKLEKITINQGIGQATQDKKLVENAQQELTLQVRRLFLHTLEKISPTSNFVRVLQLVLRLHSAAPRCTSSWRDL